MSSARSTRSPGRPAVGPPRGHRPDQGEGPRRRRRAAHHRTGGVRHLFAALKLGADKMYRHPRKRKKRARFLEFCRYLRGLHPPQVRIAIVCDNFDVPREAGVFGRILIFPGHWAGVADVVIRPVPSAPRPVPRRTGLPLLGHWLCDR
jgi:hypothetical protein